MTVDVTHAIVAVTLVHSHALEQDVALNLKLRTFAQPATVLKPHQIQEQTVLNNANTNHVDQTHAQAVEAERRPENSILMVKSLFAKVPAMMNATHAKHAQKKFLNALKPVLIPVKITTVPQQHVAIAVDAVVVHSMLPPQHSQ